MQLLCPPLSSPFYLMYLITFDMLQKQGSFPVAIKPNLFAQRSVNVLTRHLCVVTIICLMSRLRNKTIGLKRKKTVEERGFVTDGKGFLGPHQMVGFLSHNSLLRVIEESFPMDFDF